MEFALGAAAVAVLCGVQGYWTLGAGSLWLTGLLLAGCVIMVGCAVVAL
jgi:hypothetical protein